MNESEIKLGQTEIDKDIWSNPATKKLYKQFAQFYYECNSAMKSYEFNYWKYANGKKRQDGKTASTISKHHTIELQAAQNGEHPQMQYGMQTKPWQE